MLCAFGFSRMASLNCSFELAGLLVEALAVSFLTLMVFLRLSLEFVANKFNQKFLILTIDLYFA